MLIICWMEQLNTQHSEKYNQMKKYKLITLLLIISYVAHGKEYHVSTKGDDLNTGTENSPFKTISKAAQVAYPGDVITVHAGTYREWINPPRGGISDEKRIVYRAAPGELVEIKGSERITGWEKVENGVWKVVLPNTLFGNYNPYQDSIIGDWFYNHNRVHHTGEVFLNNKSLYEKETLDKVLNPVALTNIRDTAGSAYVWYCESDREYTTIWANFHSRNPNKELVEVSARHTCFYPDKPGINYITIQGFHISQAATQWAPPTAGQIGMIATHWNKGWIIEDNVISNSKCSGITLGKERKTGQNAWQEDRSISGAFHYIEVIFNTLRNGWSKENIGSHIVRNNTIFACGQTGICGSMGAAFSIIENNHIYDIWTRRQFSGDEIAGIKFHGAIDTQIRNNRIHNTLRAVWLDWMTQGTRVSGNLFYDNDSHDIFFEVNHGPFLVDNNIMCSAVSVRDISQGGAYVHNLFAGSFQIVSEGVHSLPYHIPHQTDIAGLCLVMGGDNRYYNNLFLAALNKGEENKRGAYGLGGYDDAKYQMFVDGNVYYNGAIPFSEEKNKLIDTDFIPQLKVIEEKDGIYLSITSLDMNNLSTSQVNTGMLGKAKIPKQVYEQPDGTPISIDTDYSGNKRNDKPKPGPFELIKEGENIFKVW